MKTSEELDALKEEYAVLKAKLSELTDEELTQINGGASIHPALLGAEVFLSFDLEEGLEISFKQQS